MQLCFGDRIRPTPDAAFRGATRRDLGRGAWIESVPNWLSGHVETFELLLASADWQRHRRQMYDRILEVPRCVAGMPGTKPLEWRDEETFEIVPRRGTHEQLTRAVDLLKSMAVLLGERYGRSLGHVSLNLYRDGSDSVAFHGDKLGEMRRDTIVAIVSVGERRRFSLRPAVDPAAPRRRESDARAARSSLTFSVGEGDLFVMGGTCQETWEHALPKMMRAGPRIAIMFREERAFRASPRFVQEPSAGPSVSKPADLPEVVGPRPDVLVALRKSL